jgi:hypothetical protein
VAIGTIAATGLSTIEASKSERCLDVEAISGTAALGASLIARDEL